MDGYIFLFKKILDWEWYQDANVMRLFLHLLLTANYELNTWRGIEINRGQVVTSIDKLSTNLKISNQQTKTAINKLQNTGEITIKATNKFSMITICNYENYQDLKLLNNKQNNKQSTNKTTDNQQTKNLKITTTNKYNEDNKEELNYIPENLQTNLQANKRILSERSLKFSEWFKNLIPNTIKVTDNDLNNWRKCYDDMIEIDKRDVKEIVNICKWARQDEFWKDNFLSPLKLRRKNKDKIMYYDYFKEKLKSEQEKPSEVYVPGEKKL